MGANISHSGATPQAEESVQPYSSRILCPLCAAGSQLAFTHAGYPIRDCGRCGHRFAGFFPRADHVEEVYGDGYFEGGGAGYPDYLTEAKLLTAAGERYGKLLRRFIGSVLFARSASEGYQHMGHRTAGSEPPSSSNPSLALRANKKVGRLLDVGAAAGFLLKGYSQAGWQGEGVEPNRSMAEYGQRELGQTVHCGTLESVRLANRFEAVSFVQVLAHLPEPMETFRAADALTEPGGLWLIETWNSASRTARWLGGAWHEYSPPSVLHWWTPKVLERTLGPMGYRLRATGFAQKWIGMGHAQSLLQHKYGDGLPTRIAKLLPGSWKLPYPSEDLFWAVYQKGIV